MIVAWQSSKRRVLGPVVKPCAQCGGQTPHMLRHDYKLLFVMLLPFGAHGHDYAEVCTACGLETRCFPPPGIPALPFLQIYGAIVSIGAIVLVLAGVIVWSIVSNKLNHAKYEAMEAEKRAEQKQTEEHKANERAERDLYDGILKTKQQIETEDRACGSKLMALFPAPKARFTLPDRKPKDLALLAGGHFVVTDAPLYDPNNPLLKKWACSTELPPKLDKMRKYGDTDAAAPLPVRKSEADQALVKARRQELPPVVGVIDGACDARTKKCQAVGIWVKTTTREVLAVARAAGAQGGRSEKEALDALGADIARKVSAWN
jgi:hypothetical protein